MPVHDQENLVDSLRDTLPRMTELTDSLREFGTSSGEEDCYKLGDFPIKKLAASGMGSNRQYERQETDRDRPAETIPLRLPSNWLRVGGSGNEWAIQNALARRWSGI